MRLHSGGGVIVCTVMASLQCGGKVGDEVIDVLDTD